MVRIFIAVLRSTEGHDRVGVVLRTHRMISGAFLVWQVLVGVASLVALEQKLELGEDIFSGAVPAKVGLCTIGAIVALHCLECLR